MKASSLSLYCILVCLCVVPACLAQLPDLPRIVRPDPEPDLPAAFDVFTPPVNSSTPAATAPVLAEWTRTGSPDDTLVLTGSFFPKAQIEAGASTQFIAFGQTTSSDSVLAAANIRHLDGLTAAVTLPGELPPWSMYLVWPTNSAGLGSPAAINRTEAWWLGPKNAAHGQTTAVYGRNLAHNNSTNASWVYLKPPGAAGQWANITSVNPYRVAFTVPPDLASGQYEVWIHNGHGAHYGWSGPLTLIVYDDPGWTGPEFNVRDYGAKGDGITDDEAAIQAALDAAGRQFPYATIYFPAGTYMVSRGFYIYPNSRWRGDGKDATFIKVNDAYVVPAEFDLRRQGLITGYATNFEVADMTLDANGNLNGYSNKLISVGGSKQRYTNLRIRATGASAAQPNGFLPFDLNGTSLVFVNNCEVIGRSSFLGSATQLFLEGCNYYGTDDANSLWEEWGGSEISMIHCTGQDYDNSRPDGWAQGRFFIGNGLWGCTRNLYLGDNASHDLTVRPEYGNQNTGEQFMWEGNISVYRGTPLSATPATVTFSDLSTNSMALSSILQEAVIVSGAGLGQHRRIVAFDEPSKMITVQPPWNVPPDATSSLLIEFAVVQCAIYHNYLDAKDRASTNLTDIASVGVSPFGGCYDFVVDHNTFNQVREGIASWGHGGQSGTPSDIQPSYFHLYANNTFQNVRWGARSAVAFYDNAGVDPGLAYLGDIYRNNSVSNVMLAAFNTQGSWSSQGRPVDLTVYEHNHGSNLKVGINLAGFDPVATNTVV